MRRPALGELEIEVLRYVSDHAPVNARQVADKLGETQGLARTTILTVMENLRSKGYLVREKQEKVFLYAPAATKAEMLRSLVNDFVEKTLKGSVSPVVAYLANTRQVSDDDLDELETLVEELRAERKRNTP